MFPRVGLGASVNYLERVPLRRRAEALSREEWIETLRKRGSAGALLFSSLRQYGLLEKEPTERIDGEDEGAENDEVETEDVKFSLTVAADVFFSGDDAARKIRCESFFLEPTLFATIYGKICRYSRDTSEWIATSEVESWIERQGVPVASLSEFIEVFYASAEFTGLGERAGGSFVPMFLGNGGAWASSPESGTHVVGQSAADEEAAEHIYRDGETADLGPSVVEKMQRTVEAMLRSMERVHARSLENARNYKEGTDSMSHNDSKATVSVIVNTTAHDERAKREAGRDNNESIETGTEAVLAGEEFDALANRIREGDYPWQQTAELLSAIQWWQEHIGDPEQPPEAIKKASFLKKVGGPVWGDVRSILDAFCASLGASWVRDLLDLSL